MVAAGNRRERPFRWLVGERESLESSNAPTIHVRRGMQREAERALARAQWGQANRLGLRRAVYGLSVRAEDCVTTPARLKVRKASCRVLQLPRYGVKRCQRQTTAAYCKMFLLEKWRLHDARLPMTRAKNCGS